MKTKVKKYGRGDKTVTLVGVSHIGTKSYYDRIQLELDSATHDKVIYEGVEGDKSKSHGNITKLMKDLAKLLKLSFQSNSIKYNKKEWINSDLDTNTLIVANPSLSEILELDGDTLKEQSEAYERMSESKFTIGLIKLLMRVILAFRFLFKSDVVLLNLRNGQVLIDMFRQLKDNDSICLFYGDAHLKGIEKTLKKTGFKKKSQYSLKPFKVKKEKS